MWPLIKLLPEKTNFKYVAFAPFLGALSVLACLASIYLTIIPLTPPCGGLNCGVDFKGGSMIEISTAPRPVDHDALSTLGELGLGEVVVQGFTDPTAAMVRYETPDGMDSNRAQQVMRQAITERLGEGVHFGRAEVVGAKVSGELFLLGAAALGAGIALMLVYIWFRFGFTFGAADFCADICADPADPAATLHACSRLVIASRAGRIAPPVASVFTELQDLEALRADTERLKRLGFFGRSAIHPRQVEIINAVFQPTEAEVAAAARAAFPSCRSSRAMP